jgi:ATP phosphoribosyltransferase
MSPLIFAIPSKGRLMDAAAALLERAGFGIVRKGTDRLYRGSLQGIEEVEIAFLSASEIASALKDGKADLGITGEDLLRETIAPDDPSTDIFFRLGFGPANVVVAVPESWRDVANMADLDEVSEGFYERHGRRLRVATK